MEKKLMLIRGLNAWEESDPSQWNLPESFYSFATNLVLRFFSRPSKAFGIVSRTCVRLYTEVYDLVYPKEVSYPPLLIAELVILLRSLFYYVEIVISGLFHPFYFLQRGCQMCSGIPVIKGGLLHMKALSKYELNWWTNNISVAYSAYKDRVRKNTKVSYEDLNEQLMPILMKSIDDIVYGKLCQASNLSEGIWITIGMSDVAGLVPEGFKKLYLERSEQHCKDIRVKCEPVREQRDKFLVKLYSRPSEEDLEEINQWIYKINHTEDVGGCEL